MVRMTQCFFFCIHQPRIGAEVSQRWAFGMVAKRFVEGGLKSDHGQLRHEDADASAAEYSRLPERWKNRLRNVNLIYVRIERFR